MSRDYDYEKNNIAFNIQYPKEEGGGIKCKNYELCKEILPKWWFDCKGSYLCTNCHMLFGTGKGELDIKNNIECPICLEEKTGVSQPNCDHFLCIHCFRRCYYGEEENYPDFPYNDNILEEWAENPENSKWEKDYPLIKKCIILCEEILRYENEAYLRCCPLCRK